MASSKDVGTILKNRRISAKMTRADIAEILCVTEGAVAKYEEGKNNVPMDSASLYAEALNTDVMDFLRLTGHMPADIPVPVWKENGKWRIGKKEKEMAVNEKTACMRDKIIKEDLGEEGLMRLAEDMIRVTNMAGEETSGADRIRVETSLLAAVVMYSVMYTTYPCHSLEAVRRLLAAATEDESHNDCSCLTPLQYIFEEVEMFEPESPVLELFRAYMAAPKYLRRTALSCLLGRLAYPRFPDEFRDTYFEDYDEEKALSNNVPDENPETIETTQPDR